MPWLPSTEPAAAAEVSPPGPTAHERYFLSLDAGRRPASPAGAPHGVTRVTQSSVSGRTRGDAAKAARRGQDSESVRTSLATGWRGQGSAEPTERGDAQPPAVRMARVAQVEISGPNPKLQTSSSGSWQKLG